MFYPQISAMKGALSGITFYYQPSVMLHRESYRLHFDDHGYLLFLIDSSAIRDYDRDEYKFSLFTLITEYNDKSLNGKAVQYILDKESTKVMNEWFVNRGCKENYDDSSSIYNVVFLGADGKAINVKLWKVNNISLMNFGSTTYSPFGRNEYLWKSPKIEVKDYRDKVGVFYATPFVGCVGESYLEWLDFEFYKDDLPKIKQVCIEIAE